MNPIEFEGCNVVIAANQPPYKPLPGQFTGGKPGMLLTCWELDEEEFEEIARTRRIWNSIMTFDAPLQPHCLSADRPIAEDPELIKEEEPEVWRVVKVAMQDERRAERVENGDNLSKQNAADLANELNTRHRASQMTHYFKAIIQR